jgi:hypothetical protein
VVKQDAVDILEKFKFTSAECNENGSEPIDLEFCTYIVTCYCIYEIQNLKKEKF